MQYFIKLKFENLTCDFGISDKNFKQYFLKIYSSPPTLVGGFFYAFFRVRQVKTASGGSLFSCIENFIAAWPRKELQDKLKHLLTVKVNVLRGGTEVL